jgi:hypothetical protein
MHRLTPRLAALALLIITAPLAAADKADKFFFKKNDRIIFLGDSITMLWTL